MTNPATPGGLGLGPRRRALGSRQRPGVRAQFVAALRAERGPRHERRVAPRALAALPFDQRHLAGSASGLQRGRLLGRRQFVRQTEVADVGGRAVARRPGVGRLLPRQQVLDEHVGHRPGLERTQRETFARSRLRRGRGRDGRRTGRGVRPANRQDLTAVLASEPSPGMLVRRLVCLPARAINAYGHRRLLLLRRQLTPRPSPGRIIRSRGSAPQPLSSQSGRGRRRKKRRLFIFEVCSTLVGHLFFAERL